jgi:excisionase family DNA binding protein
MTALKDTLAKITNALARIEDDVQRLLADARAQHTFIEPPDRSLKVSQAAELLACDDSEVRRLLKKGELRGHTIGTRGVRVLLSSLNDYRQRQAIVPQKEASRELKQRRRQRSKRSEESTAFLRKLGLLDDPYHRSTETAETCDQ